MDANEDSLIEYYFHEECSNIEILAFLNLKHNINISLSTVKRRLRSLGLRRRVPRGYLNNEYVREEVGRQLVGSGQNLGKSGD